MAYQSKHTGATIDASVDTTQQILNMIYPIGSIYMSVNNVSPATFIGGTWVALTDRVLIGAGSSYAVNATGGAITHTHTSAAHTHTTAGHTLTVNEMPKHNHYVSIGDNMVNLLNWTGENVRGTTTGWAYGYRSEIISNTVMAVSNGGNGSHSHGNTGSTTPGNTGSSSNLPPYLAVYMWKRTA